MNRLWRHIATFYATFIYTDVFSTSLFAIRLVYFFIRHLIIYLTACSIMLTWILITCFTFFINLTTQCHTLPFNNFFIVKRFELYGFSAIQNKSILYFSMSVSLSVCLSVCRRSQTAGRNSCSIVSGDVSKCFYRLTVHPVTSSRLSSS